jgi:hypothetical protein
MQARPEVNPDEVRRTPQLTNLQRFVVPLYGIVNDELMHVGSGFSVRMPSEQSSST